MKIRYTLVTDDKEFLISFQTRSDKDLPIGYPCLVRPNIVGEYHPRYYIYIPPNIKCLDSFIAGVNAAC